jgi:type I restriction enzyme, S subunit
MIAGIPLPWPVVPLSTVAQLVRGVTFSSEEACDSAKPAFLPVLRAGNIEERLNTQSDLQWIPEERVSPDQRLRVGDIAICMSSGSASVVGKTAILDHDWIGCVGSFCAIIRPRSYIEPHYLAAYLKGLQFTQWRRNQAQGANIQNLRASALQLVPIPLPPKSEQKRIVEILQEADEIRHLRVQADAKTNGLIPAIFEQHFRHLNDAPHQYLGSLLDGIQTGWSPNALSAPARRDSWGVLKLSAISSGRYIDSENKELPHNLDPDATLEVRGGDVLLSRKNTRDLVGACVYVWETRTKLIFPDLVFRLMLKPEAPISAKYLWALLSSPSFSPRVRRLADGAAGSMPNIPIHRLERLRIPIPDSQILNSFDEALLIAHQNEVELLKIDSKQNALTASLSAYAFSGQLTERWRRVNQKKLAKESRQRDDELALAAGKTIMMNFSNADSEEEADLFNLPSDLNRDQSLLLFQIKQLKMKKTLPLYFTAEFLADRIEGALHRHPQAIETHLNVFAVRGLVIPVSRARTSVAGQPFAASYRLPARNEEVPRSNTDNVKAKRMQEQRALATQLLA